jgi:hypothetical protein
MTAVNWGAAQAGASDARSLYNWLISGAGGRAPARDENLRRAHDCLRTKTGRSPPEFALLNTMALPQQRQPRFLQNRDQSYR